MITLIGIHGKKHAGKDSIGNFIKEKYPEAIRMAFGDELKKEVARNYGVTVQHIETCKVMFRPILQAHGELMRQLKGEDYWLNFIIKEIAKIMYDNKDYIIYITDVRHLNEARFVREVGGHLWKVNRKAVDNAGDSHISETALKDWKDWNAIIHNDGDLKDLKQTVLDELSCII